MKYKPSLQAAVIALVGVSLVLPGLSFAASSSWNFHQQPEEGLIPLDQLGPRQTTGEYDLAGGHKLSLGITADKKYIDITPRARVKFKVELLDNGRRVTDLSSLGDAKTSTALRTLIAKPQIQVNITKLDGHIGRPLPAITINEPGLTDQIDMKYQGGSCTVGYQPYWSPLYTGKSSIGEIRNQLIGAGYAGTRAAFDQTSDDPSYALFDLKNGEADFEYIYGGVRTMPFVEFAVGVTTGFEGRLQSQLSLPFADQINKTSTPIISDQGDGEITYKVGFSEAALAVSKEQKFTVSVEALKKGRSYSSPFQRIRLTALPVTKAARVDKLSNGILSNGVLGGFDANDTNYSPLAPDGYLGQVSMLDLTPGEFVVDDKINYEEAGLLYTGPYRSDGDCQTSASIEVDLINGKANIDYLYKGDPGINRQITFLVQPINYFVDYAGWPIQAQVNLDNAFRNKNYDWIEKRRSTPTYREAQNLVYPLEKLPFQLESNRGECRGGVGIKEGGCAVPQLALYGETWMPALSSAVSGSGSLWGEDAIDSLAFSRSNYTIASLPIGHRANFNFWLWVLIAHALKIVILVVRLVILKKRHASPAN